MTGPAEAGDRQLGRRYRRFAGSIIGLVLLSAAVIVALRSGGNDSAQIISALRAAPLWLIALALLLPAINWLLISFSFWVGMRRLGRVGLGEMLAVIGAAWLLNYLPLRPGLFGRIAYHRAVNQISVAGSVRVTVIGLACGGLSVLLLLGLAAALPRGLPVTGWLIGIMGILAVAGLVAIGLSHRGYSWLPVLFILRFSDVLVWAARYAVIFHLAGLRIDLPAAIALAAVSQAALLIPFIGNGLGVREWAIGLAAAHLPFAQNVTVPAAITADLLNRVLEISIAIPIGIAGALWLAARKSESEGSASTKPDVVSRTSR